MEVYDTDDVRGVHTEEERISCDRLAVTAEVPLADRAPLSATLPQAREFLREEYGRAFHHDHWDVGIANLPLHAFLEDDVRPDVQLLPPPARGSRG